LNTKAVREAVTRAAGRDRAKNLHIDATPARDWIASSLAGLPPVNAGRFLVHGSHDRSRLRPNSIGIEIEAALAFGTGHHGTTRGCLIAIDTLAKKMKPRKILDVGTGTGVLAMAAAKIFRTHILASDIDPRAVRTARDNAQINRVAPWIETIHAAGFAAPKLA